MEKRQVTDILSNVTGVSRRLRKNYFADAITKNSSRAQVLFNIVNSVLNPKMYAFSYSPLITCEAFLDYFVQKISEIKSMIEPSLFDPSVVRPLSVSFDHSH